MDVRIITCSAAVFLTAFAAPTRTKKVDFRARIQTEVVVVEKNSPAYAAFEDVKTQQHTANISVKQQTEKFESVHLYSFKRKMPGNNVLHIKPLVVAQYENKEDHLAKIINEQNEVAPLTAKQMAEVLVEEELRNRNQLKSASGNNVRKIETESGQQIVIARGLFTQSSTAEKASFKHSSESSSQKLYKQRDIPRRVFEKERTIASLPIDKNSEDSRPQVNTFASKTFSTNSKPSRYVLGGALTFAGGAAFLGQKETVTAKQYIFGQQASEGIIDLHEAIYEIQLDSLEGELVVEVRSSDGQIIGQGNLNLSSMSERYSNQSRIRDVPLEVRPVYNGTRGQVVSAASYGHNLFKVPSARMQVLGIDREIVLNKQSEKFSDDLIAMPSQYVLRSTHDNFWPTLSLAESGSDFLVKIFPKGLVEAFLNLTLDKFSARDAKSEGIIWGRVTQAGRTVAGAKLYYVGDANKKAHYFSGFIPDANKTMTTQNGEFAYSRIIDSEVMLRASFNQKMFLPTMLPIQKGHVTYADLELEPNRVIDLMSYDGLTNMALSAVLQPLGTNDQIIIHDTGTSRVQLDSIRGLTLIESDPGEPYLLTRAILRPGQTELHFPQFTREWAEGLRQIKQNQNYGKSSTFAIGVVSGDNFEVIVGSGSESINHNISYFDTSGKKLSQLGLSGGGFIIYDLPRGQHTITIIPEKSKKVITQTIYVDEYAAHVSKINLLF